VEHSLDLVDLDRSSAAEVAATARAFGLSVNSVFTGLAAYSSNLLLSPDPMVREAARSFFVRAATFSGKVGAVAVGGHVGAFSVAEWTDVTARVERWAKLRTALREIATVADGLGQKAVLVENLAAAREPSTMAMMRELVAEAGDGRAAVRLALDVGHMCVDGTAGPDRDPYAWLRALGKEAFEVQLQQSDSEGDHHWPFTAEANRRGRIDADRVIDALGESGVEAMPLILEVIPPFEQGDATVLDDLVASVGYWSEALARRGVAADD
jgi:sugar phosphate isomerase/epimerase